MSPWSTSPWSTRRSGRIVVVAALAVAVAVACSDPPTSGSGEGGGGGQVVAGGGEADLPECPLDALDEADGPTEITLWYGGIGGPVEDTLEGMVAGFNDSQDQVELSASNQGASYEEVYRKFESAAAADPSQLPDIVYLENTQLQVLADSGLVLPAQACMEAADYDITEIEPVVRASYSVGDVLYPGYMNVTSQVLYYNKAHWVKAGLDPGAPPQTMDELYEQAEALKAAGVSEKPLSFKVSHTVFENWLSGQGVDVVNNGNGQEDLATEATFDTPEAQDALERLKQMNDEGLVNVFASVEGGVDHYLALATQQSSMLIETSGASTTVAAALGGLLTPEDVGVEFDASVIDKSQLVPGTGPFPGIESAGQVHPGGGAFFIVSASEPARQAASWRFLEFMLRPENAKTWHINGSYLPIVKSVSDEPDVQAFWQDTIAGVLLKTAVDQQADADPDEPGPLIGPYVDFTDEVQSAIEAVLVDDADIATSLADAQDTVTESLQRYAGS
jgi:sn-glycerol 3-phosphate transport system substrate-binding protein